MQTNGKVSNVYELEPVECRRTAEALDHLRAKLADKQLIGLAYIAICRGGKHEFGLSGEASDHPDLTVGLATRMIHKILAPHR
jgi:hypothetical protein